MDPAALGTTIIGLERIRRDDDRHGTEPYGDQEPIRRTTRRTRAGFARERIALFLRRTADQVSPTPSTSG